MRKLPFLIVGITMLAVTSSGKGDPVCNPSMLPAQCAEAQLAAISSTLGAYKAEVDHLSTEVAELQAANVSLVGKLYGQLRDHSKECTPENGQINCNASCNSTEVVVSGICIALSGGPGAIQNFGLSPGTNEWHCLWNGAFTKGRATAFCLPK